MSRSFEALHRANPRARAGFQEAIDAAAYAVRARIERPPVPSAPRRRLLGAAAAGLAIAAAAAVAVVLTVASRGGENARAAITEAATVSAASAERSGTAVVGITHDGRFWAGSTIRWNGGDLAVTQDGPQRAGKAGSKMLLVGGTLYGVENGRWVSLGDPSHIDPGSGTTPAEYMAAAREDVGGVTLRRITAGMTGLTTQGLDDGSKTYTGTIAARLLARETGFKEGRQLRVLPFGYAANGQAADPAAPLSATITVGPDRVFRQIVVTWGSWRYAVTYSGLGTTPALAAPAHAQPIKRILRAERAAGR